MERGVGGEVEMHSTALSKSRFNRLFRQERGMERRGMREEMCREIAVLVGTWS